MAERCPHDSATVRSPAERCALITGGARGILAQALERHWPKPKPQKSVVTSRNLEKARAAANALPGPAAGEHRAVVLDYMEEASIATGFAEAVRLAGQVDVLVNNGHEGLAADWTTVSGEQFTRQLANATGYFLLAREFRDHAVSRRSAGSVIMLGSMYGVVGSYPDAYAPGEASPAAYHALKGGIVHLTRHLAVYWARDRVRVNCLSPGPFPAPPHRQGDLIARPRNQIAAASHGGARKASWRGALLLLSLRGRQLYHRAQSRCRRGLDRFGDAVARIRFSGKRPCPWFAPSAAPGSLVRSRGERIEQGQRSVNGRNPIRPRVPMDRPEARRRRQISEDVPHCVVLVEVPKLEREVNEAVRFEHRGDVEAIFSNRPP